MSSIDGIGVSDQVHVHLSAIADAVDGLCATDLTGLPDGELTVTMRRLERSLRRASTVGHNLIVETAERSLPGKLGHKTVNKMLVEVLRISATDASARVTAAKSLGTWHSLSGQPLPADLPETAAAQRDGAIGPDHARAVREVIRKIPHAVSSSDIAVAEQILADLARSATPEDVEKAGHDLLAHLNPDGDLTDVKDRKRLRGIRFGRQDQNLMTPISGHLDPETRALLEPILAKWARPGMNNPDDPESPTGNAEHPHVDRDQLAAAAGRTATQRNHDAVKEALRTLLGSGVLGSHRGLPVTAIITMTLDQLEHATGVATTASGGIVPIKDALKLAERSHPVLVLFDHNGRPLHLGRSKRLATADQRLALIAADRGCTRPGCDAPATMTAVHHVRDWSKGGTTDIGGLALGCDACHALIHDGPGGWHTHTAPEGTEYAGRTEWIPPPHLDPDQTPRINHRHHPRELLDRARRRAQARREADIREWRGHHGRQPRPPRDDKGDVP
ncbi:HNH endonuclease signature motif containing protein [Rhodococcus maanshanensis]|uniref:HNH endonuclease n=1 Tax=Rhodococcus maanshanensis TaxID=183556 RepID=A0A1H7FFM1_9NOCA|nr:HNH endonuclease signature motif containing protein [Rhodococcus maanshanensis]SEK24876.1 HNH endonuclease [Rhodococcus maanshanensis]